MDELQAVIPQVRERIRTQLQELAEDLHHGSEFADLFVKDRTGHGLLRIEPDREAIKVNGIYIGERRVYYVTDQMVNKRAKYDTAIEALHFAALCLQLQGISATEAYRLICMSHVIDDDIPF